MNSLKIVFYIHLQKLQTFYYFKVLARRTQYLTAWQQSKNYTAICIVAILLSKYYTAIPLLYVLSRYYYTTINHCFHQ